MTDEQIQAACRAIDQQLSEYFDCYVIAGFIGGHPVTNVRFREERDRLALGTMIEKAALDSRDHPKRVARMIDRSIGPRMEGFILVGLIAGSEEPFHSCGAKDEATRLALRALITRVDLYRCGGEADDAEGAEA